MLIENSGFRDDDNIGGIRVTHRKYEDIAIQDKLIRNYLY